MRRGTEPDPRKHPEAALARYDRALQAKPNNAVLLNDRGVVLLALGRLGEALSSHDKALAIKPDYPEAHNNRGNVLQRLKRFDDALSSYDRALAIKPDYPETLSNRGLALQAMNRLDDALSSYDRALAIKPDSAAVLNNRGNALQALGRLDDALSSYDRALALQPTYAEALNNRGNVLQALDRPDDALASHDKALALRPSFAEAHNSRGTALRELHRPDEAVASYDRALAIRPAYPEALNNCGTALRALNRHDEALARYDKALTIRPAYPEALNNRGTALRDLNRLDEALASYDKALTINPDHVEARYNRAAALRLLHGYEAAIPDYERALQLDPDIKTAPGMLLHAKLQCCDWRDYAQQSERVRQGVRAGKFICAPFVFLSLSESPGEQLQCAKTWVRNRSPASPKPVWNGERYGHERIRVAYLSADFREHPVSRLLVELFESHDRSRFETIAVSYGPESTDRMRARVKGAVGNFIDIHNKSDRDAANLLRGLEVDIAVDLMGFTEHSRLEIFALRPAPVQVGYLGYVGTTGAGYIDYILADRFVIPAEHQDCYTEKVVYLPDTFQANPSARAASSRIPTRAEAGLPDNGFVFCSFNNDYKISPPLFDIWMRLLSQVDGSVLWLVANNAAVERNLRREAERRGIPSHRLIFAPRIGYSDYLARYRLADLFLDTLPFNACTTASDALSAGLPLLTCSGQVYGARMAGSILQAVGLSELITSSLDGYERLALRLAQDGEALASVKAKLARNLKAHPLFDVERFRRHLEAAYVTMWQRSERGELPASFAVDPMK